MRDRYIEKSFLYLLVCSVILHVAMFIVILSMPAERKTVKQEPYMVELRDLPALPKAPPGPRDEPVPRVGKEQRVERETAPRGERERDKIASLPPAPRSVPAQPQVRPAPAERQQRPGEGETRRPVGKGEYPVRREPPRQPTRDGGGSAAPRREKLPDLAQLMPSADKMARLEESYRKKYGPEVEEGETKFLNTKDILFGSFLRRFENAVYGVWRYPSEAVNLGIEGTTPVRITFNRSGEIVKIDLLQSSGSKILDEEVVRTLRQIGPVGSFPKAYQKDTFNLIAFFQYGLVSGSRRLH